MQAILKDFFAYLVPGHPLLASLSRMDGLVTDMTIRKNGQLLISCLLDKPFLPALLCELEAALERQVPADEVIISQRYATPLNHQDTHQYTVDLAPWMLRHLWHQDAMSAAMLRQASFRSSGTDIQICLHESCCQIFDEQQLLPLKTLCRDHADLDCQFRLVAIPADAAAASHPAGGTESSSDTHNSPAAARGYPTGGSTSPAAEKNYPTGDLPPVVMADQAGYPPDPYPPVAARATRSDRSDRQAAAPARAAAAVQHTSVTTTVAAAVKKPFKRLPKVDGLIWGRIDPAIKNSKMSELDNESFLVCLVGEVFDYESRPTRNGASVLIKFNLTDLTSSITCVIFCKPHEQAELDEKLADGYVLVNAEVRESNFGHELQATVRGVQEARRPAARQDTHPRKRVELHCHTKMSTKDAVCDAADVVKLAASFGQPAVAITDHGIVQSFPDACTTAQGLRKKGKEIKIIYGMEGYLVDDGPAVTYLADDVDLAAGFIALDVETTGLDAANDRVIEVAAVLFMPDGQGGYQEAETFESLINPGLPVPPRIVELTGITTDMLTDAPEPLAVMAQLAAFIGERPVVAHNAFFDLGFLRYEGFRVAKESDPRIKFNPPLVDTLALARIFLPDLENHKLNTVAAALAVDLGRHHRAVDDAGACGLILTALLQRTGCETLQQLNVKAGHASDEAVLAHRQKVYHIILLAQDNVGLYNLYRLVSASHTRYFHMRPRIPRALLQYFRHGLIVGSACEAGEVFQSVLGLYQQNKGDYEACVRQLRQPDLVKTARFYNYLEIQPVTNNRFYLRDPQSGLNRDEDLRNLNRLIVQLGQNLQKPVCATCDVHFLEKRDAEYRKIMLANMGYEDAEIQPEIYFRTTGEMLDEFAYLGEKVAQQVVIDNPAAIADRVNPDMKPFPDGSFPPIIASAAEDIRKLTWDTAMDIYGRNGEIPEVVRHRTEHELKSIIDNGFAIMYYIAYKLVKKSNDDGYIVGSRGSVGSSLVATFCGISEVNPLPPHYFCPSCRYSEFIEGGGYGSGYDLPAKVCPECGTSLTREGQDIPFETFLGFNGDKQPDIDLNFSGEYQARAHKFIEEMFGASHTFRAGTIGGYADKNAQAMVVGYFKGKGLEHVRQAEISRLSKGLIGVKRTTGQHPGGIVVVPKERDVYDFTPIQHPADKRDGGTITTHFDFNAMHDTILKLDILGHDDPTMLKMLGDLTGVDVRTIPIPDDQVMSLFRSTAALGIPDNESTVGSATLGLPELGTFMAREMIRETQPSRFFDLVQLMGLSHGTDVWKGNAQELIRSGTCTINDVIGCRDSIMTWLIYNGLPPKASFDIMEKVRKGKGLSEEHENLMEEHDVPEWYIDSCKKIKYMFPKAHAAAYTISSLRIAWFKVYYPEEYYCAYFTVRADEFDSMIMCRPAAEIRIERERRKAEFREAADREQKIYYILELVEEMQQRGIDFLPIDLYASESYRFAKEGKGWIRPPLNAIPGISATLSESLVRTRADGPFKSRDELMRRAGIGQAALDALAKAGCLDGLPESAQIDLFSLFS